jgi:hypothetical protein
LRFYLLLKLFTDMIAFLRINSGTPRSEAPPDSPFGYAQGRLGRLSPHAACNLLV